MKRNHMRAFCAAVLAIVFGSPAVWAQGVGRVTGRVTGPTGEPLPGASVTASGIDRVATTRADGSYQLVLPVGKRAISARLPGYAAATDTVMIASGVAVTKDLRVEHIATSLETVAIVGTRGEERSVMSAAVPIDVLSVADLRQSGRTETAQMIQAVAPSFNFPRATIADGTDHIRPATLRGLSPDQALVLVNGKRRHASALVNVNGFVGRGSQAVDLNAIPASMIDHIEILRDGAAAQYGSDAIAGVINIVLKANAPGSFSIETGENWTTYNRDAAPELAFPGQREPQSVHDGAVRASALDYGWTLGSTGYFQLGGELREREGTNRTLPDTRPQYFPGDPRNLNAPTIDSWQGDSYNHDSQLFFNGGQTFTNGVELYAFGGYGHRRGASAGMWRRPNDDRTVRAIYPDGFLPFIKSKIDDGSFSAGFKGDAAGWKWDLGTVYGVNAFRFGVDNSANVSIGATSKTSFDAGRLLAGQSSTTLDLSREVSSPWHHPLHVALGGEFRVDQYKITAGDSDSYRDGKVPVLSPTGTPTDRLAPLGSQVFPGFRPTDAGSHSRNNVAGYLDLESNLTSNLLVGAAGRVERYSDFGSTATGKLSTRLEIVKGLALRGALSTGFRAPTLGQEFFSSTATNFSNGSAFDVRTFPVTTAEARVLGASDLKPEKSVNVSAGLAIEPVTGFGFTADYYHIDITDRIVLTDNFVGLAVQALLDSAGLHGGAGGGRYFSNAIDTRSNGVDLVADYSVSLAPRSTLRFTSGYNYNEVKVIHVDATPDKLKTFQEVLFSRVERARIEKGNPRDNLYVSTNYTFHGFSANARTQRYGEVSLAGGNATSVTGPLDQTFGAKWITDLSASLAFHSRYTVTFGADNLFDVYPDRNINPGDPQTTNGGISNFGLFPYNGISPFGFNGRFVYTRLSIGLQH